jgi:hypothetical protein
MDTNQNPDFSVLSVAKNILAGDEATLMLAR